MQIINEGMVMKLILAMIFLGLSSQIVLGYDVEREAKRYYAIFKKINFKDFDKSLSSGLSSLKHYPITAQQKATYTSLLKGLLKKFNSNPSSITENDMLRYLKMRDECKKVSLAEQDEGKRLKDIKVNISHLRNLLLDTTYKIPKRERSSGMQFVNNLSKLTKISKAKEGQLMELIMKIQKYPAIEGAVEAPKDYARRVFYIYEEEKFASFRDSIKMILSDVDKGNMSLPKADIDKLKKLQNKVKITAQDVYAYVVIERKVFN